MNLATASGSTASATRFGPIPVAAPGDDAVRIRLALVGGLGLLVAVGLLLGLLLITAGCGPPN
jgi:hypothetical protein